MTAALVEDVAPTLRAMLDRLPLGEALSADDEAELAQREDDVRAGMAMRSDAQVMKALEERHRRG